MTGKAIATVAVGVVAMGAIMFGITRMQNDSDVSQERISGTSLQPVIKISTETPDSLTFQISAATVDICYVRSPDLGSERDLFDPDFLAETKALGFNRVLKFADGAIANVSHTLISPLVGKGYNGQRIDFKTDKEFNEAMGGVLAQTKWKSDFFSKTTEYVRALGVPDDVVLNPNDTWAQNKYRIENSTGEYIFFGSEETTTKIPKEWTAATYLAWAKPTRDSITKYFPNKKLIVDQSQIYKGDLKSLKWRRDINPTTLTGMYGADAYFQLNDILKFTLNMDSNAMKVSAYFDSIIPFQIDSFKRSFPGWKMVGGELNIVDARPESEAYFSINKNMVGVYAWGLLYITFIKNQDIIPFGVHMELKKYIDPNENNTKAVTLFNSFIRPGYSVLDITLENMAGCRATVINNTAQRKQYAILLTNASNSTYILPKVVIDGKNRSPNFTQTRMYASTWDGVITKDTTSSATITIPPKSVQIISFTTGTTVPTVDSKIK